MQLPTETLTSTERGQGRARVLVIDDDPELGNAIRLGLSGSFQVAWEPTAQEGISRVASWHPDVVLLDLTLPDLDGIAVCQEIRTWAAVPIIVLSVRNDDQDKVVVLDSGADDYLTKPFSLTELKARLRVALRHAARGNKTISTDAVFQLGELLIDFASRSVTVRDTAVHLNPTEYGVLTYLAQHAGQVVTHHTLLRAVWGPLYEDALPNLRVIIAGLRRKLEVNPARPKILITDPGVGYRLAAPSQNL